MMKDKVKGLILGIAIGTVFTGTTIYADYGAKQTVWNKTINFFMNGERKLTEDILIVNGTSYVPLKTVSKVANVPLTADFDRYNIYLGSVPSNKGITAAQAIQKIKSTYGSKIPKGYRVELDNIDQDGNYTIHVYEVVIDDKVTGEGHTATFDWYTVDKYTGTISAMFDF
ncbi:hypothetical protein [Paenibacillus odorifer]|uniref:hypothetical protein n=1 Tax=Paenibacillus odorifer TaxID=189426 RepID=UPI00117D736F|nr:hypothetical protein [Paenibacillus odorifer]